MPGCVYINVGHTDDLGSCVVERLKLIICPVKAVKMTLRAASRLVKHKKNAVMIAWFMDLPKDVALEVSMLATVCQWQNSTILKIISYVHPLDLLNLCRVSKHFRAFFMSQTETVLWNRVLSQMPKLPPCPEDLTHPQYTFLLFERPCMVGYWSTTPQHPYLHGSYSPGLSWNLWQHHY